MLSPVERLFSLYMHFLTPLYAVKDLVSMLEQTCHYQVSSDRKSERVVDKVCIYPENQNSSTKTALFLRNPYQIPRKKESEF